MADDLADFSKDLRGLAKDLQGPGMEKTIGEIGTEAEEAVAVAVRRDLGPDGRMSNWPRARFEASAVVLNADELSIKPFPRNMGPMTVAERGRKAGMSRAVKRGRRRKDGTMSKPKASRKVSASRGLNTWTDAGFELDKLGRVVEGKILAMIERWL